MLRASRRIAAGRVGVSEAGERPPASTTGSLTVSQDSESSGRAGRLTWMREARLGLFIHWGLYSVAARHEWVKQRERLDDAAYQRYFDHFDPDRYAPRRRARLA